MAKLSIFLCLALCGVCAFASPQVVVGGANEATPERLKEFQTQLQAAFDDWSLVHRDFDLKVASVKSGKVKTVAGAIWDCIIEDTNSGEWSVQATQNLDGSFKDIKVTRPGKEHHLSWP